MNRRQHLTSGQQFRSVTNDDGTHTVSGYAAMFNVLSKEMPNYSGLGMMREQLAPGCFDAALQNADVTCNVNHDDDYLLGRTSSGTLRLSTDAIGLKFEVQMPDTSYARDLGVLMQRGDLKDCSFAFTVDPANIDSNTTNGETVETIRQIEALYDTSIVCRGAYSQPFSVYRSNEQVINEIASAVSALAKNPEVPEVRTDNGGKEVQATEAHKSNVARALALLDLQYKSQEVY